MQTLLSNLGLTKDKQRDLLHESNSGPSLQRGYGSQLFLTSKCILARWWVPKWKKERYPIETKSNPYKHSAVGGKTNIKNFLQRIMKYSTKKKRTRNTY